MKKRITLNLPAEVINYIKTNAKERGITASQVVEEWFRKLIAEEEAKSNLRKVS